MPCFFKWVMSTWTFLIIKSNFPVMSILGLHNKTQIYSHHDIHMAKDWLNSDKLCVRYALMLFQDIWNWYWNPIRLSLTALDVHPLCRWERMRSQRACWESLMVGSLKGQRGAEKMWAKKNSLLKETARLLFAIHVFVTSVRFLLWAFGTSGSRLPWQDH